MAHVILNYQLVLFALSKRLITPTELPLCKRQPDASSHASLRRLSTGVLVGHVKLSVRNGLWQSVCAKADEGTV